MTQRIYPFIFIFLFLFGFLFRIILMMYVDRPFESDQKQYDTFAIEMLKSHNNGLYVHTFRLYGYPLFVALIYKLSGFSTVINPLPWKVIQAFLDTMTGFLIFSLSKKIFQEKNVAYGALILYLVNPYTSFYVGVLVPEVLAAFLFSLLFLVIFKSKKNLLIFFLLGLLLGYIPQVRPAYVLCTASFLLVLIANYLYSKHQDWKRKTLVFVCLVLGFAIPFLYTVLGNYKFYRELSVMDIDRLWIQNFYISMFVESSSPSQFFGYPQEVKNIYSVYSAPRANLAERKAIQDKYLRLAIGEIRKDPWKFITWRIKKLWYVWEQHNYFPVKRTIPAIILNLLYWANILLLFFAAIGSLILLKGFFTKRTKVSRLAVFFLIFPLVYTSFANAFTTTEERYSLPVYPILMILSSFGFITILTSIRLIRMGKNPK